MIGSTRNKCLMNTENFFARSFVIQERMNDML